MNACEAFRRRLSEVLAHGADASTWPIDAPEWSVHVAACARCRKLLDSESALESILDALPAPRFDPRALTRLRISAGAEARLDALLDLHRVATPAGLAARIRRRAIRRRFARRVGIPVAAGIAALALGWLVLVPRPAPTKTAAEELASAPPEPEMLRALDVLEQWDLLLADDLDVLLSTFGVEEEVLFDYHDDAGGGGEGG